MLQKKFNRKISKFCQFRDAGKSIIENTKEILEKVRSEAEYDDFMFIQPLRNKSSHALKIKFLGYVFLVEVLVYVKHFNSPFSGSGNELKSWRFSGRYKWSLILEDHPDPHELKTDQALSIWFNPASEFWFQAGIDSPEDLDSFDRVGTKKTPKISVKDDLENVINKVFEHYINTWPEESELSFSSLQSNDEN